MEAITSISNTSEKWRCNFSMIPQQGTIEAQGVAGDYKTGQKLTHVFKDLPDLQVKLEHNEIIILSDVTRLGTMGN